jgi:selenocysteine-specific elongation factor
MTHVIVGTAGHIDHGKSTLVLALTGTDPDRLQEEKTRGITIDLGFAHTVEDDVVLSFVDVPGHERFVRNMLAGAGGVDLVVLHVAADESVMPQTREHFDICRLLRIRAGLVVLTKCDLVDADTLDVVRLEVQELIAGSFLDGAAILPVSARTGAGLSELRHALARLARALPSRRATGAPRLPVDRVFSMRGFGTVVTGTLVSGRLGLDDDVVLLPSARPVKIRGLQVHGRARTEAVAGQRVAVNLSGVEVGDIARGETLTTDGAISVTRRVDAAIESLPSARVLRHGARVRFHQGTRELAGRLALSGDGELQPGSSGFVRIHLDAPAVLVRGDRVILRTLSPVATIGGGVVLDPLPPRRGVRTPAARARFARLAGDDVEALLTFVDEAGLAGMALPALSSRAGVPPEHHAARLRQLQDAGSVVVAGALFSGTRLASLRLQVVQTVRQHHARHPLDEGMPREELRERLFATAPHALFEHVLAELAAGGEIVARDRVALRGHSLALTEEEARARDAIVDALGQARLAPPDEAALAARAGVPRAVVERIVGLLVRQKVLVRLGDLVFHESALTRLKEDIRSMKTSEASPSIDVGTFKERYQVTRKYAIPLLEFLDRERVTRRTGDERHIL